MQALRPSKGDGVRLCLTLLPDEKVTKESPRGGHPLWVLPLGGIIIPPAALPLPPEKGATPGCPQKLNPPAAPRIDSGRCDPRCNLGRKQDRFAHKLKVANRSIFVAEALSRGCGHRRGSEASPSGDSKGRSPWRAFGDFPRGGKVTRGAGRSARSWGLWGPKAPAWGVQRGASPSHRQEGAAGRSACISWGAGAIGPA